MKKLLIISFVILLYPFSYGQQWIENLPDGKSQSELTLSDYKNAFDAYWEPYNVDKGYYLENGEKKKAAGWKQFNRWYWNMENQVDAQTGLFPQKSAQQVYDEFRKANPANKSDNAANWTSLGPNSSTGGYAGVGRINCVAFHPSDNNTYWVGAPAGGLWMTTDNGSSWTCLTDGNAVLGVSDIIIPSDYSTSQTIYIGTGDRDAWDNRSVGVLKSTDGGSTWNTTDLQYTLAESKMVSRLLLDPNDDQTIIAATSNGVYKTTNGGANWDNQLYSVDFIDMEYKPGTFSTLYGATKWGDIYRSTNGGATWSQVHNNGNRIELAVTPANSNYVYAVVANSSSGLEGIYRSTNSGASFSMVFSGSTKALLNWSTDGSGTNNGQGWYDLSLAVSPSNANTVVVGGISSWKSTNGGSSWSIMNHWYGGGGAPAVHADKHQLKYRPNGDLFECNDGGVYISTNGGISWSDKTNGMVISQMYKLGVAQTVNNETITGLQDNGTKLKSGNSWSDVKGGDGMECLIDYTDKNIQYGTYVNGQISRTTNHWASSVDIEPSAAGDGAWVTPYIIDPNNHNTLYAGYADIWKTNNKGDSWTKISTMNTSSKIRSMAIAPSNTSVLYVADPYTLWKTTNGGSSWTDVTGSLTNFANITYIAVKNDDPNTVWVTLSGYNSHGVYKTTDGGTNWTNLSTGLPQLPIYSIVQNYQFTEEVHLYVATELGVYFKQGEENWVEYNTGLPNVRGGELEIYYDDTPADSKLRYATYGRGLWESEMEQEAGGGEACDAPENLIAEVLSLEDLTATLTWEFGAGEAQEFRYDDGIATGQLGSGTGTTNTLVGNLHTTDAELTEMSWYLTSEGGPHTSVSIYVIGLDASGVPDGNNVLFTQSVTNTDDTWNTFTFDNPIDATGGFFLGVGYNGFVALGTDNGIDDPYNFVPGTHYFVSDYTAGVWETWETYGFEVNGMIRALGVAGGKASYPVKETIAAIGDLAYSAKANMVATEGPEWRANSQDSKAFIGFNVYRDGDLIASNISETSYTDEVGDPGEYCYEVSAVYSLCGESDPSNEDCVVFEGSNLTVVAINPNEQTVSTNETFTTTVEIADVNNLGSFELELSYDPDYIQASSVTLEDFLGSTGRTVFPMVNTINNTSGLIEFAVTTMGATPPGADGDGILLTVEWVAAASVDDEVNTDILIQNLQVTEPDGTVIPTSSEDGTVIISPCYSRDFDCDCDVDIVDITMAAYAYGSSTGDDNYNPMFDLDSDGDIDIVDITMIAYDYGWSCDDGKSTLSLETFNSNVLLSIDDQYNVLEEVSYMNMQISGIEQMGAYEFALSFDPQDIEILEINGGEFLSQTGRETMELASSFSNEEGSIQYAITSLGSQLEGAYGYGELLSIKYRKKTPHANIQLEEAQIVRIDGDIISFEVDQATGLNEAAYAAARVYPVPMKDLLYIEYQVKSAGQVAFELQDMNGKAVYSWQEDHSNSGLFTTQLQRKNLESGTYLLSIKSEKSNWKQIKVVIH